MPEHAATKKKEKKAVGSAEFSNQMAIAIRWFSHLGRRKLELGSQQGSNGGEKEWERWRARVERKKQSKNEKETVKFLGIWGFLFVLIIDCFVVNFLDWICNLSYWILVCLEDNDVIFGTIDFI